MFLRARKLIDEKVRFVSHNAFYNDCIAQDVIPKGLSLHMQPTFKFNNPINVRKWSNVLKHASLEILKLLSKESRLSINSVDRQLKDVLRDFTSEELRDLEFFAREKLSCVHGVKRRKAERDGLVVSDIDFGSVWSVVNILCESHVRESNYPNPCTVFNLSSVELTSAEISVLSKGLSFVPSTASLNDYEILDDLQQFSRRLHLRT